MAHFAKLENNKVINVIVVNNETINDLEFPESEPVGQEFLASLGLSGEWKQTSYNGNFRGAFAGIGYAYNEVDDIFVAPELPVVEEVVNDN